MGTAGRGGTATLVSLDTAYATRSHGERRWWASSYPGASKGNERDDGPLRTRQGQRRGDLLPVLGAVAGETGTAAEEPCKVCRRRGWNLHRTARVVVQLEVTMASFAQSRQVLKAYDNHLITEREALEMVDRRSVSELRCAFAQKATKTNAGVDGAKTRQAQVVAGRC